VKLLSKKQFNAINEGDDGDIWIGTSNGIHKIEPKSESQLLEKTKLKT